MREPKVAVAAVIIDADEVLLVRRGTEPSLGKWSIPGGHVLCGETLEEALVREVIEETGLVVEVIELAGVFDLIEERDGEVAYHYVIIDYFAEPCGGELAAGDDAAEVIWVPVEELSEYDLSPHLAERLEEMGIRRK
ncbi:MAG: NUDIX hydrolase [Armatimonadota bacterium]